ncbi:type III-A CRISPR-associated protein Cas10/Csm1 [Pyrococcus kukulkanii]|uniref:CRISPR system single-strand-specific deoxyribonuclease Cas10/Csm1 (subtype III-A) n=1 Tax=Pyrococcus kukulkanii TaxID=1609559 RepID=A0ABV4T3H3_9EURY
MNFEELVALGGLLHDIGKPVQRAGIYKGDHSKQGAEFLRKLARITKNPEYEALALFSEFHHSEYMKNERLIEKKASEVGRKIGFTTEEIVNALWIVYKADNFSSAEREEIKELSSLRPLGSVFNPNRKYPLRPLELENPPELPNPEDTIKISKDSYLDFVVKPLEEELSKAPLKIDRILPILEKYLTFVSSVTVENNVISLYDHMKMTSAIALAMVKSGCTDKESIQNYEKDKKFLLIEGDFSGIQSFIYSVSGKGTLKYLRARSSYLELISWDIVLEVIRRLDLTLANIIFNAGGHFLLLAQNTPKAIEQLKDIRKRVAKWLYQEFDGDLYLALEWLPVSGEELGRKCRKWDQKRRRCEESENLFKKSLEKLRRKVNLKKLRQFSEVEDLFIIEKRTGERLKECQVCGKEVKENALEGFVFDPSVKACKTCNRLAKLGMNLLKVRGFILDKKGWEGEEITNGPFRKIIPYYGGKVSEGEFLLLKNTLTVPEDLPTTIEFVPYLTADYAKKIHKNGSEEIATFDQLTKESLGAKRLGILKGDVDKLGEFFRSLDSPSKLATASRFVDYFFKVYLRYIIENRFQDVAGKPKLTTSWPEEPDIVVVYAGGDDFFIVGAWNQIFDLAFRIRNAFRSYTGGGLTLSAGLAYFHPKTPIYRMAAVVSERLETAKDEGRDRIYVIERTKPRKVESGGFTVSYRWENYEKLWNEYGKIIYKGDGKLNDKFKDKKGLLIKILQLRELYVRDPRDVRWAYMTAYMLGRHGMADMFPALVGIDANAIEAGTPQPIYWVDGILKIILMVVGR